MKIALLLIATGKYWKYIPPLIESAEKYFLFGHEKRYFVHTDMGVAYDGKFYGSRVHEIPHPHEPWPGPTLHRYRTFAASYPHWKTCHFAYYCDADMLFTAPVGSEVIGSLVACQHPGFAANFPHEFPYERRRDSTAYVPMGKGTKYFCGGFQGGATADYYTACQRIDANIAEDERKGTVAAWHDESHWNRYCIHNPPTVVMASPFVCPEQYFTSQPEAKLLALLKDHEEMRKP